MVCSLMIVASAVLCPGTEEGVQFQAEKNLKQQVEWVMFLMHELESRKPAQAEGNNGAYEVGLLLEIADKPVRVLKLAAEQHSPKPNDTLEMVHEVVVDRKDNKGVPRLGHMLSLEDGKLALVVAKRPFVLGEPIAPFSEYYSNACIIDSSIERYGKRDLKKFKSQRLTKGQLTELKAKLGNWDGGFAVPELPASAPADAKLVGSVRSVEAHLALAAVKKSGAVVYGKASGGTLFLYAHATYRDTAIKALREDSVERSYTFLRLKR